MAAERAPAASRAPGAWLAWVVGAATAYYLRFVGRTCRLSGPLTREQVILTHWHEFNMLAFLVAVKVRGDLQHASFSTQGFRGDVINAQFRYSGAPVRVLPLPGERDRAAGAAFARRLSRLADEGFSIIVTPDGPFGPAHVAKPGALIVARQSGLPIVPWAFRLRPAIRLTGRWDRQLLPLPFSRIRIITGEPVHIAPREPLKPRLAELQAALEAISS
jgi:lysophospholipid acyltransferase (LPLAT)-like uncharacterized protein